MAAIKTTEFIKDDTLGKVMFVMYVSVVKSYHGTFHHLRERGCIDQSRGWNMVKGRDDANNKSDDADVKSFV